MTGRPLQKGLTINQIQHKYVMFHITDKEPSVKWHQTVKPSKYVQPLWMPCAFTLVTLVPLIPYLIHVFGD